jgi:hypothetical protein
MQECLTRDKVDMDYDRMEEDEGDRDMLADKAGEDPKEFVHKSSQGVITKVGGLVGG